MTNPNERVSEEAKSKCCECRGSGHVPVPYPAERVNGVIYDWEWEWEACPYCQGTGHRPCEVVEKEERDGD